MTVFVTVDYSRELPETGKIKGSLVLSDSKKRVNTKIGLRVFYIIYQDNSNISVLPTYYIIK
jgi:hypothetical protein